MKNCAPEGKVIPLANRDFSTPHIFNLTTKPPGKTIDIGRNGFSLSLDAQGRA
jgi:hypothetical protein